MLIFFCVAVSGLSTLFALGPDQPEDPTVYVIEGTKGTISERDEARIEAGGIAGTSIDARIEGPAKLKRANIVVTRDGKMLIGATKSEFNIHPTGKGLVTVVITSKSPTQPNPEVKTYRITVN